ncbi:MAG: nickel pincer cofactor biosynthesis protein LarC [Candidatus Omnitrophota bacterium]
MKKILYLDCYSGISGDMFLGSLIELGLNIDYLTSELRKIKIKNYKLECRKVKRNGIAGTKFDVVCGRGHSHEHAEEKTFSGIVNLISNSALSKEVKEKSVRIFTNLAQAESVAHGISRDKVHFHEVGDVDSIVDIVGACMGIEKLGIGEIYSSRISSGSGRISAHGGSFPNPAPATAYLLEGAKVDFLEIQYELVTPTGAAIVKTLSKDFGEIPSMRILKVGYGAGTYEIPNQPNLLRSIIGEKTEACYSDVIMVIETNIDDMSPQTYEYLIERCLAAGALDAYLTPVIMKKSRPGCVVTILAEPSKAEAVSEIMFKETTTFGIRRYPVLRKKLDRRVIKVKTGYGEARVKLGYLEDKLKIISPEYDDCKRIAGSKGISFRAAFKEAESAAAKILNKRSRS